MKASPLRAGRFESRFTGARNEVFLVDNTLRDGEQTAGVVFANQEKVRIAKLLSDIGVHELEAGSPWLCAEEREAISEISSLGIAVPHPGLLPRRYRAHPHGRRLRGRRSRHLDEHVRPAHPEEVRPRSYLAAGDRSGRPPPPPATWVCPS